MFNLVINFVNQTVYSVCYFFGYTFNCLLSNSLQIANGDALLRYFDSVYNVYKAIPSRRLNVFDLICMVNWIKIKNWTFLNLFAKRSRKLLQTINIYFVKNQASRFKATINSTFAFVNIPFLFSNMQLLYP